MSSVANVVCPHCPIMESRGLSHTKNCKCGHHHAKHNYCGGCTAPNCKCDIYDQTEVYVAKEPKLKLVSPNINVDKLVKQIEVNANNELVAAQSRVDVLRKKAKELSASRTTEVPSPD